MSVLFFVSIFFISLHSERFPKGLRNLRGEKETWWESKTVPAAVSSSPWRRKLVWALFATDVNRWEGASNGISQKTCLYQAIVEPAGVRDRNQNSFSSREATIAGLRGRTNKGVQSELKRVWIAQKIVLIDLITVNRKAYGNFFLTFNRSIKRWNRKNGVFTPHRRYSVWVYAQSAVLPSRNTTLHSGRIGIKELSLGEEFQDYLSTKKISNNEKDFYDDSNPDPRGRLLTREFKRANTQHIDPQRV